MRARRFALAVIGLVACGPAREDEVVLREVCGQSGPVRVFELDGDRDVPSIASMEPVSDKLLWSIVYRRADMLVESVEYWITDRCGESPRELQGVDYADVDPAMPDIVIARQGDQSPFDWVATDPEGARASRTIFEGVGVFVGAWQGGLLSVDDVEATVTSLSFRPYPAEVWSDPIPTPIELTSLLGPFTSPDAIMSLHRIDVRDEEIWAVDGDDDLVRITSPDAPPIIEQASVGEFALSADGRWLAWRGPAEDLADLLDDDVHLLDRTTGEEVVLSLGAMQLWYGFGSIEAGVLRPASGPVLFPGLEPVPLAPGRSLRASLEASEWVVAHDYDPYSGKTSGLSVLDILTGDERSLFLGETKVAKFEEEGMELVGWIDFSGPPRSADESNLLWVPYDGAPATELARAVTVTYQRLDDGRVVTPLDVDDRARARLVLVDPVSLDEATIDRDVETWNFPTVADADIWGNDVVLYQVDDGDRSGMWIAALPEAP